MDFKENLGVDPVTLGKGYTKLDGDPPNSGENILKPEHRKRAAMYPGVIEGDGPSGFFVRDKVDPYLRPMRSEDEDAG